MSKLERFQQKQFVNKINEAREYKREVEPTSAFWVWFKKIGLVLFFLLFVSALVFLDVRFFNYTQYSVTGTNEVLNSAVKDGIADYVTQKKFLFIEQGNFVFFRKQKLRNYLLNKIPNLYSVEIKNQFPNKLEVVAEEKNEKFIITDTKNVFTVYSDGKISRVTSNSPTSIFTQQAGKLIKVILQGEIDRDQEGNFNRAVLDQISKVVKISYSPFDYKPNLIIAGLSSSEVLPGVKEDLLDTDLVIVYTALGVEYNPSINSSYYKLYINTSGDVPEVMARANLVISKLTKDKFAKLYYLDMRTEDRAFMCFRGSPCEGIVAPQIPVPDNTILRENLQPNIK